MSEHSGNSSSSSTPCTPFPATSIPNTTATWPNLQETIQFERAASAILNDRPHTISSGTAHPSSLTTLHSSLRHSSWDVQSIRFVFYLILFWIVHLSWLHLNTLISFQHTRKVIKGLNLQYTHSKHLNKVFHNRPVRWLQRHHVKHQKLHRHSVRLYQ